MINKLNRPNLGRLAGRLLSGNASRADEAPPLEVASEIQVLAARITELLAMGDHPQSLTPEQQAQWGYVKAPFSLMYTRYNISRVYHTWRRNPEDAEARQAFQSTLLGVLTTDAELLDKFNAALPPPVPEWIAPDEETLAAEHAAPTLPVQPEPPVEPQPELLIEPQPAPQPEPLDEPQPTPQSETPAAAGSPDPRTGFDDLVRELWTDEDFYRIVYALRYSTPGLFNQTASLADQPQLSGELEASFTKAVTFLAADAGVARFLADEQAQNIVKGMANDGLYQVAQKLASLPDDDPLIGRLVGDQTPFLATLQVLAAHPEMDALLAAILRLLANDPASHVLPDDENFARLVLDLAESQAALDPARRDQLYELVKGFAMEPESQDLARKILFTSRFPRVAARLADDDELIKLVRRMLDDEQHKKVAEMLEAGGDSAQVILSVAEDPEFAETITRMCEDKAQPAGFNELVKKLRSNDNLFFDQVKTLSDDEQLLGLHDALVQRPLNATTIANRLSDLGERLHNEGTDEEAITTYMLAIRLDPGLKKAYQGHAQACLAKGYYTQCVEDYKTLIKKDKLDTTAHLKLGQVYLLMGLLKEAEECFRKVLELSTDTDERQQADDGLVDIARKENL